MKFAESFVVSPGGLTSLPRTPQTRTVALISQGIAPAAISFQLAASLRAETRSPVVLIRLDRSGSHPFPGVFSDQATVVDWAPVETVREGQFRPGTLVQTETGFDLLTLGLGSHWLSPDSVASLLSQLRRYYSYVLIEASPEDLPEPTLGELLERSDLAYVFVPPTTQGLENFHQFVTRLGSGNHQNEGRAKPVFCLDGESDSLDALVQPNMLSQHRLVRDGTAGTRVNGSAGKGKSRFGADVRRLAREVSGRLVGLALSSGAAKGFAHIGVIQVLEENGIEVDVVAGASIGAYIGAVWTYGYNGREMETLARELEGRWGFWQLIDPAFPPRHGFLRGFALRNRLMRSIGNVRFADLPRPMRVVAGNLSSLARAVFAGGEVATAVHASMAVPGICVPVTIEGETYIDGGIVDPVPVDALRDMGAHRVIAVNTIPTPERMRESAEAERDLARLKRPRWRKLFHRVLPLDKPLSYLPHGNLFEIIARSIHGAQVRIADASCRLADVVLRPDVRDDRWLDCRDPRRFIALGRAVAERQIDQIKTLVDGNETEHEQEISPGPLATVA